MKKLSVVLFTLLLICYLSANVRSGNAGEVRGVTDDTLKIGMISDQTGPAANVTVPLTDAVKRHNVNNIILCGFIPQPAGLLLRELKKFGMNVPVFANVAAASEEVIYMAAGGAEKYYVISPWASWYDEGEGVALMRKITLKYEPGTEKQYRGKLHTYGWTIGMVLQEGLLRAGRDIDGERLVTALETLKDFDMKGLSGPMNFSSTNHKGMNSAQISKADPASGKFAPVTGWIKTD
ncbi:MAG: ABC transporter substrate-binding protein [Thermodesulfobacteriota bacterium]